MLPALDDGKLASIQRLKDQQVTNSQEQKPDMQFKSTYDIQYSMLNGPRIVLPEQGNY